MICGNIDFNNEIRDMLEAKGWEHGTMRSPGHFVQEEAGPEYAQLIVDFINGNPEGFTVEKIVLDKNSIL